MVFQTDKQNPSKSNPPISKTCKVCKVKKLLIDFEFSNNAKNKRVRICKTCVEEKDEPYGACCQQHFDEMVISNTFTQLELLLQVVEAAQYNIEIPHELLAKIFKIAHKGKIRCRHDRCDYDGET
jgi:protein-arginine kinase activator protein McsA